MNENFLTYRNEQGLCVATLVSKAFKVLFTGNIRKTIRRTLL